jgi:hypothetical protein
MPFDPPSLAHGRRLLAAVGLVSSLCVLGCTTAATSAAPRKLPPPPMIGACPIFPETNAWNQPVDRLPVARNSSALIQSMGADLPVVAGFGSGTYDGAPFGMPFVVVRSKSRRVAFSHVSFDYASQSDRGPYPVPPNLPVEGGGDRHALVVDLTTCRLYELFRLRWDSSHWSAGSGAIWDLRSNALRPDGYTSADAAGLPILPGLARWAGDASTGVIRHAIRFGAAATDRSYVFPARHFASNVRNPNLPPMGTRVRLKASVDISNLPPQARMIAQAMKTYGLILADNGAAWHISGAPSNHWSNDELKALANLHGGDFEVVDASSLQQQMKVGKVKKRSEHR